MAKKQPVSASDARWGKLAPIEKAIVAKNFNDLMNAEVTNTAGDLMRAGLKWVLTFAFWLTPSALLAWLITDTWQLMIGFMLVTRFITFFFQLVIQGDLPDKSLTYALYSFLDDRVSLSKKQRSKNMIAAAKELAARYGLPNFHTLETRQLTEGLEWLLDLLKIKPSELEKLRVGDLKTLARDAVIAEEERVARLYQDPRSTCIGARLQLHLLEEALSNDRYARETHLARLGLH
jgi:hypothetical protein